MHRARWRIGMFPPAARRGLTTLLAAATIAAASVGPVLAATDLPAGQPDDDTYIPPLTAAQEAIQTKKLAYAAFVESLTVSGGLAPTDVTAPSLSLVGDPTMTPGSGSTGGSTGFLTPRNSKVLNVRARHQSTVYWCGPASAQVVINYSRGYVYDSLNGDSTATNWKTQATIANG